MAFKDVEPPGLATDYRLGLRYGKSFSRQSAFRVLHREWSGQMRAGVFAQPAPGDAPEANTGTRFSDSLTKKAVTKIFEAAAYVATTKGGFSTFLTLTFDDDARQKLFAPDDETPETTIGKEVSRFMDGVKKVYQRGMKDCFVTDSHGDASPLCNVTNDIPGNSDDFDYIWVAECPPNEDGEPNPHVHVLLRWRVERHLFRAWAERLENIWGHGFAHLERIKHKEAAGKYIIKAVAMPPKAGTPNRD